MVYSSRSSCSCSGHGSGLLFSGDWSWLAIGSRPDWSLAPWNDCKAFLFSTCVAAELISVIIWLYISCVSLFSSRVRFHILTVLEKYTYLWRCCRVATGVVISLRIGFRLHSGCYDGFVGFLQMLFVCSFSYLFFVCDFWYEDLLMVCLFLVVALSVSVLFVGL